MRRTALFCLAALAAAQPAHAIQRHPTGVNVNMNGATTVYITFGGLEGQSPAEALWCGELLPAVPPDLGQRCDPATVFGSLPARYDLSSLSSDAKVFTDIMSIPASVARRAYQAAAGGQNSAFFYVRRFTRPGGPDEYVSITCRLGSGGARVPFALTDVKLAFEPETPVLSLEPGSEAPAVKALLSYTGSGRLKGRWEVVLPGQQPPSEEDLLPEGSLTPERRARQRRYTELARFNVYLPPAGRTALPGPDPARLPTQLQGQHWLLLRIEASDEREADSNLELAGAGSGVIHSGGAAGFPIPPLRYVVGGATSAESFTARLPEDRALLPARTPLEFRWNKLERAEQYRVEIQDPSGVELLSSIVGRGSLAYAAPPFLASKIPGGRLRWRVVALGSVGEPLASTPWRELRLAK